MIRGRARADPGPRAWSLALTLALGSSMSCAGCKQKREPELKVFDEQATPAEAEALAALAPPWPAPERTELANGLAVHWLVEPHTPGLHLRLLVPRPRTQGAGADSSGSAYAVVAQTMALELERRVKRYQARVEMVQKPGRFEFALHASSDDFRALMRSLRAAIERPPPARTLELGRRYLDGQLPEIGPEARAISELVARLTGGDAGAERVEPAVVAALTEDQLFAAWARLFDPRASVFVVHSGLASDADEVNAELSALASAWSGPADGGAGAREDGASGVHARLGVPVGPAPAPGERGFLLGETPTPVVFLEMPDSSQPVFVFGRLIETPTSRDRSMARLAQRVLQEIRDVRLTIFGAHALLLVRTPIRPRGAHKALDAASLLDSIRGVESDDDEDKDEGGRGGQLWSSVTTFQRLTTRRESAQRLFQATQLWLGARMVEASLAGEDWSALWSDAIDLSTRDGDIPSALAQDAKAMLETTPEALLTWQKSWMDPGAGQPGWLWIAAGDAREVRPALRKLGVPVTRIAP